MKWNLSNDRPIYLQLSEVVFQAIAVGKYPAGSRLPSVRELAAEAGVNPNTMQRALAELEREGLLYSQRTAGRFVTDEMERIRGKRKELAMDQVQSFLSTMKDMGYTAEETVELIRQAIGEEEKK
ncbi:MAG: GntR family transcriptional regulator [Eubacteriales bacterium]|nr:GntR family transcriptional regulator [Eubacteriales bacterium]